LGGTNIQAVVGLGKLMLGIGGKATAANLAARLFRSPRVGTWTGIQKAQLGKWLQDGDFAKALDAAGVSTGELFNDSFGHDAAVLSLVGAAEGNDGLFNKRAVYVDPDGNEIEVPDSIVRSFAHGFGQQ
jgi:hypothetical protein